MSQENVEMVRREYVAFAARDWIALAEIWHPEIEYEVLMGAGTFRGLDQVTRFSTRIPSRTPTSASKLKRFWMPASRWWPWNDLRARA